MVGRERKWTEDPAKAQRVRAALEACIRKKGSDVSIAKLFQTISRGVQVVRREQEYHTLLPLQRKLLAAAQIYRRRDDAPERRARPRIRS